MNAISLETRYRLFATTFIVLLIISLVINIVLYGFDWRPMVVMVFGFWLASWMNLKTRSWFAPLAKLDAIAREVSLGRFDERATCVSANDEIGRLCWSMNDMLDQIEPYCREVNTAFKASADGKYFGSC